MGGHATGGEGVSAAVAARADLGTLDCEALASVRLALESLVTSGAAPLEVYGELADVLAELERRRRAGRCPP